MLNGSPDVLLVSSAGSEECERMASVGLRYIAAVLRKAGISVELIDGELLSLGRKSLAREILKRDFKILGMTMQFQKNLLRNLIFLDELRAAGLNGHVSIGGHSATFCYKEILTRSDAIDSVVLGEGEYTFLETVTKILNGEQWRDVVGIAYKDGDRVISTGGRDLISDLDALPWPVVEASEGAVYPQLSVLSSRGCPLACSFCSISAFYSSQRGKKWRVRSVADVLNEIEYRLEAEETKNIFFVDDNFFGYQKTAQERVLTMADEIERRRMKFYFNISVRADSVEKDLFKRLREVGLRGVFLGIESGNQTTLDLFNKKTTVDVNKKAILTLRELGIPCHIGFVMINPYSTLKEIREDVQFLHSIDCGPDINHLNGLDVYPGTSIFKKVEKDGLLGGDVFGFSYRYIDEKGFLVGKMLREHLRPILWDANRVLFDVRERLLGAKSRGRLAVDGKGFEKSLSQFSLIEKEFKGLVKSSFIGALDLIEKEGSLKGVSEIERPMSLKISDIKRRLRTIDV